ncbi:Extracellular membrane protein, CFEM domain [Penicillium digitatum]|uniref:Extracellular membrane protein, CFEM domain n=1 Tax=Penicillium digitatum TaxID=36651 RepID=A0A7T6XEB3_PENDI|nr:Extracellular membrane protein, CFEM domain [Penicillium digitatum]
MKLTIFFPLAAFLSWTVADPLDDASPCLIRCINEASAVAGCVSSVDYKCTCPSPAFKDTLGTCLKVSCTPDDVTVAGELHKARCGGSPPQ